jgi:hypothetical protein
LTSIKPWAAAFRKLGVNLALAQDSYRTMKLPPGVNPATAAKFLTLSATAG